MKNRKRIVALLLTGTLAMSMLGGCGNEGSAESSGTSQGKRQYLTEKRTVRKILIQQITMFRKELPKKMKTDWW